MISIEITPETLDSIYNEIMTSPDERARKKCLVIYLKGMGLSHSDIYSKRSSFSVASLRFGFLKGATTRVAPTTMPVERKTEGCPIPII